MRYMMLMNGRTCKSILRITFLWLTLLCEVVGSSCEKVLVVFSGSLPLSEESDMVDDILSLVVCLSNIQHQGLNGQTTVDFGLSRCERNWE
jgi:hypothetical protein